MRLPRPLFTAVLALAAATFARAAIAPAPTEIHPLAVGTLAPAFALTSADGTTFDLATAFAAKPTVLIFYRGGWCPFCNRHLAALAELEPQLRGLGYQIIGVSPDRPENLAPTAERHHLRYQLLSDRAMHASSAYGVAYRIPAETAKAYPGNGIDLPLIPGETDSWLPVPAAFIIGRDGRVRFVYFNPDPAIRISNADLLAAAKAAAGR
jgi:peroxiredoxin